MSEPKPVSQKEVVLTCYYGDPILAGVREETKKCISGCIFRSITIDDGPSHAMCRHPDQSRNGGACPPLGME